MSCAAMVLDTAGSKSEGDSQAQANLHTLRDSIEKHFPLTSGENISAARKGQRTTTRPWQTKLDKREITMPVPRQICVCVRLPNYFLSPGLVEPDLDTFGGPRAIFFKHLQQIVQCRGHSTGLVNAYRLMIEREANAYR